MSFWGNISRGPAVLAYQSAECLHLTAEDLLSTAALAVAALS